MTPSWDTGIACLEEAAIFIRYPHHNIKEEAKLRDMAAWPLAKKIQKGDREEKFRNMFHMLSDIQKYMEDIKLIFLNVV